MIDFDELIHNYLKRESYPKTIGKYYPSEIGNCMRRSWYSYKIPRESDIEVLKFFEAGNLVHDLVTDVIKSDKNPHIDLLATESPVFLSWEDFVISGRMDDVLLVRIEGKIYVLEVKSIANMHYVSEPRDAHVAQLQLYMQSSGIYDGMILYIERNSLKSKVFKVRHDPDFVKKTLERFSKLNSHLKSNSIPEPEARVKKKELGWQCDKCPYRQECYKDTPVSKELS